MKKKSFLLFNAIILLSFEASELLAETSITQDKVLFNSKQEVEIYYSTNNPTSTQYVTYGSYVYKSFADLSPMMCEEKVKEELDILNNNILRHVNYFDDTGYCNILISNPYLNKEVISNKDDPRIKNILEMDESSKALQKKLYPLLPSSEICLNMCGVWDANMQKCSAADSNVSGLNPLCTNRYAGEDLLETNVILDKSKITKLLKPEGVATNSNGLPEFNYNFNNIPYKTAGYYLHKSVEDTSDNDDACINLALNELKIDSVAIKPDVNYIKKDNLCKILIPNIHLSLLHTVTYSEYSKANGFDISALNDNKLFNALELMQNETRVRDYQYRLYELLPDKITCYEMCGTWDSTTSKCHSPFGYIINNNMPPFCNNFHYYPISSNNIVGDIGSPTASLEPAAAVIDNSAASNPLPNNALYKIDKREFGISYIIDNINYTNRINLVYQKDTVSGKGNDVNCRNIVKNNLNLSDLPINKKNYYRDGSQCYSIIINPYIKKDSLQALGGALNVNSKVIRHSLNLNDGLVTLQKSLYPLITSQDTCKEMCGVWENDICIAKDNAGTEVNPFCSNYSAN